jgi:hypothetical protein
MDILHVFPLREVCGLLFFLTNHFDELSSKESLSRAAFSLYKDHPGFIRVLNLSFQFIKGFLKLFLSSIHIVILLLILAVSIDQERV